MGKEERTGEEGAETERRGSGRGAKRTDLGCERVMVKLKQRHKRIEILIALLSVIAVPRL